MSARRQELAVAAARVVSAVRNASQELKAQSPSVSAALALAAAADGRFDAAVDECVAALVALTAEKRRGTEAMETALSLQEQGALRTAFELVIVWGLMPLWLPGVGVSLSRRSKAATDLLACPARPPSAASFARLRVLSSSLLTALHDADIALLFAAHYLPDLAASLMQLAFVPVTDPALHGLALDAALPQPDRAVYADELKRLLESAPAPLSIEALLLLSGKAARSAPAWLKQRCFALLSSLLLRPGAVPALLAQLFDGLEPTHTDEATHAAARLLLTPPAKVAKDAYYAAIAPQLMHILRVAESRQTDTSTEYAVRTVTLCMSLAAPPVRVQLYRPATGFLARLQAGLAAPEGVAQTEEDEGGLGVVAPERELNEGVRTLALLMKCTAPTTVAVLQEVFESLFLLYSFALAARSGERAAIEALLCAVVKESQRMGGALLSAVLPPSTRPLVPSLVYGPGGSGGVELRRNLDRRERNAEAEAVALVKLLKAVGNQELTGDVFVSLLERLAQANVVEPSSVPLGAEEESERVVLAQRIRLLTLLAHVTEEMGPGVLDRAAQILSLLRLLLGSQEEEIVGLSLAILAALLEGAVRLSKPEEILLFDLVSPLSALCLAHNVQHAEQAARLRAAITTRDQRWAEEAKAHAKHGEGESDADGSRLTEALHECNDALLPVRAKGLVTLRRMLLSRSAVALRNADRIAALFLARLHDEDSYVYLSAVAGLAALGDCVPRTFLPSIMQQLEDRTNPLSVRHRLAEAVTQIAYRLGESLSQYCPLIVPSLLRLLGDNEAEVRASALSVLASVCQVIRLGLHPYAVSLVTSLTNAINVDANVEVRRGAVLLLANILGSLGSDAPTVLGSMLLPLPELLMRLAETDVDPVVRVHASEALAVLQEGLERRLTPQTRIKTLD